MEKVSNHHHRNCTITYYTYYLSIYYYSLPSPPDIQDRKAMNCDWLDSLAQPAVRMLFVVDGKVRPTVGCCCCSWWCIVVWHNLHHSSSSSSSSTATKRCNKRTSEPACLHDECIHTLHLKEDIPHHAAATTTAVCMSIEQTYLFPPRMNSPKAAKRLPHAPSITTHSHWSVASGASQRCRKASSIMI